MQQHCGRLQTQVPTCRQARGRIPLSNGSCLPKERICSAGATLALVSGGSFPLASMVRWSQGKTLGFVSAGRGLTIHSSRTRFAGRLNSGVRPRMKIIVDRISLAVLIFSAAALAWVLFRAPEMQSSWVRLLMHSIFSASFAYTAYGTAKPPFSRVFSLIGFWLSVLAFAISSAMLFV